MLSIPTTTTTTKHRIELSSFTIQLEQRADFENNPSSDAPESGNTLITYSPSTDCGVSLPHFRPGHFSNQCDIYCIRWWMWFTETSQTVSEVKLVRYTAVPTARAPLGKSLLPSPGIKWQIHTYTHTQPLSLSAVGFSFFRTCKKKKPVLLATARLISSKCWS